MHYDGTFTRVTLWKSKSIPIEVIHTGRAEHLILWSETLQLFKGQEDKPLFAVQYGKDKEGKPIYKQVNDQYAHIILKRICKRANIRHIKPHDLRHTKCTNMLKEGIPETHVKTVLGFTKNTDMLKVYNYNKIKDYEEFLKAKKLETPPTYELLEKQKKTLENEYGEQIKEIKQRLDEYSQILGEFIKDKVGEIKK